MNNSNLKNLESLVSKLDVERAWLLKNIDNGKWSDLRVELAALEREISKFIIRANEYKNEINKA